MLDRVCHPVLHWGMVMSLHKYLAVCAQLALCVFAAPVLSAKGVPFKTAALEGVYDGEAFRGDAVAVRLSAAGRAGAAGRTGTAELMCGKKRVEKSVFFPVAGGLLALIPLSTWLEAGEYTLRIVINDGEKGDKEESAQLPVTIKRRDFISETISLDERNTAIKTDTSEARMKQIKRLNGILGTVNRQDVFSLRPFVPPVAKDTRRSSYFGDRRVYQYTSGKTQTAEHFGIDYAVAAGTAVSACADGKVVMAEDRVSTGWSVAVCHAPGLYSLYYHMSALSVKEGQKVLAGDKLGLSGATGLATGPHLHWEVRLNMCATSPDYWTGDWAMTGE